MEDTPEPESEDDGIPVVHHDGREVPCPRELLWLEEGNSGYEDPAVPEMHHPGFQAAALGSSGSSAHHGRRLVACAVDVRGARSDLLALRELQERRGSARLELAPKRGATF